MPDVQHQTHRVTRRLNYELLNQFLLHCELGHILHIEKFIKHPNIDIDFQNSRGHTPAMVAIIHNQTSYNTPKLVEQLLDGGADGDITDYACFVFLYIIIINILYVSMLIGMFLFLLTF